MIKSFNCKNTEKFFNDVDVKKFRNFSQTVRIKLEILNAVVSVSSLHVSPGNRPEQLKDNRNGQYSIRINEQCRICFLWKEGNAYAVEIVDYHKDKG